MNLGIAHPDFISETMPKGEAINYATARGAGNRTGPSPRP